MSQKNIGLYREADKRAFQEGRIAVENEIEDDDPPDARVVRELAEAYTGFRFSQTEIKPPEERT